MGGAVASGIGDVADKARQSLSASAATLTIGSNALGVPLSAFNAVAFDRALSRDELDGYFLYPLEDLLAFDARTDWMARFSK